MTVHIIYNNFFDPTGNKLSIGGIQTYIRSLLGVFHSVKLDAVIYQKAETSFKNDYNGVPVFGIKTPNKRNRSNEMLLEACLKRFQSDDLILYGCETMISKKVNVPSIAIQHGISWDITDHEIVSKIKYIIGSFIRYVNGMKIINRVNKVDYLMCVDYNFQSWYRTMINHSNLNLKVIPNYTEIAPLNSKDDNKVKIIFARRFFPYRGTRVFAEAIARILKEFENIEVVLAGSGPDEKYFCNMFGNDKRVTITSYDSKDSLAIHSDKHIAVIPTIGSEGTSLSLLEAMSSQCAVICTDVGGMTNIVLDGYNGLMVPAGNAEKLYCAIKELIVDSTKRERIAMSGYETAKRAFSYDSWADKWKKAIDEIQRRGST